MLVAEDWQSITYPGSRILSREMVGVARRQVTTSFLRPKLAPASYDNTVSSGYRAHEGVCAFRRSVLSDCYERFQLMVTQYISQSRSNPNIYVQLSFRMAYDCVQCQGVHTDMLRSVLRDCCGGVDDVDTDVWTPSLQSPSSVLQQWQKPFY